MRRRPAGIHAVCYCRHRWEQKWTFFFFVSFASYPLIFFFGLIHPRVLLYIVALSVPVVCCVNAVLDVRFVRSS